ncbi:MAG: hypothetical protein WB421_09705 [Terriglobales bacterium]
MSCTLLKSLFGGIALLATMSAVAQAPAEAQPADKYNVSGSVLSALSKHGHFYQVATDSRIYLLMCTKVKTFQLGEPECKFGDKPIATGDAVHFRIDGDWAYMPPISQGDEEKLRILTTELKVIPALPASTPPAPAPAANGKGSSPTPEPGIVIGTGVHVKGQHGVGWSTAPGLPSSGVTTASAATPVMATAPVMAVPVTGGAPVMVMPTGPTAGGVVTGVPVTGGAPITAIPTAPVMGVPVAGAPAGGGMVMMGGGAPQWVHVLRIQTGGKIYQLECSGKPCALADKEIALGDTLSLRVDKKHAYLSSNSGSSGAEQEFKILNETDNGSAPDPKQP